VVLAGPVVVALLASLVNGATLIIIVGVLVMLLALAKIDWDRQKRKDGL
jgi:hypothetical protein